MAEITIQKPVFYQKELSTPLYQLLSFVPNKGFYTQNVTKGYESGLIPLNDFDLSKVSFNISRFNRVQSNDFGSDIEAITEAIEVETYFKELGIEINQSVEEQLLQAVEG